MDKSSWSPMSRFWSTLPHVFLSDVFPKVTCQEHCNTESLNSQLLTCRDQFSASAWWGHSFSSSSFRSIVYYHCHLWWKTVWYGVPWVPESKRVVFPIKLCKERGQRLATELRVIQLRSTGMFWAALQDLKWFNNFMLPNALLSVT